MKKSVKKIVAASVASFIVAVSTVATTVSACSKNHAGYRRYSSVSSYYLYKKETIVWPNGSVQTCDKPYKKVVVTQIKCSNCNAVIKTNKEESYV